MHKTNLEFWGIFMFAVKTYNEFIQKPDSTLEECLDGPVEISGEKQSYVIMTVDYLRRLLVDSTLANQLDEILLRLKNKRDIPEQKIMSLLEHEWKNFKSDIQKNLQFI